MEIITTAANFTAIVARAAMSTPDNIDMDNFIHIDADATVTFRADPGEQIRIGFVQVLERFVFKATYNRGAPGADATWECKQKARFPILDALESSKPPWYDYRNTPLIVGMGATSLSTCTLSDSPSAPKLSRKNAEYGSLTKVEYRLSFRTWLACFNHTIARLVALREAETTMDFTVDIDPSKSILDSLPSPIVRYTALREVAATTRIPLEVWSGRTANEPTEKTWTKATGYDAILLDATATKRMAQSELSAALAQSRAWRDRFD